jgi:ligand-binding SRPBCC domain-containing protein
MKIYSIKRTQVLPMSLEDAWSFFSSPENLMKITPSEMNFRIVSISGQRETYAGQIIQYSVTPIPFMTFTWITEITHVMKPFFFVDEQRFGPYKWWHHQHHFKEVAGGVEMTDEVHYAIPFGLIGRLAQWALVKRKLSDIFDYRSKVLNKIFAEKTDLKKTA